VLEKPLQFGFVDADLCAICRLQGQRVGAGLEKRPAISFFLENVEMNTDFHAMLFQPSESRAKDTRRARLSELEIEAIDMFINFLRIIGLQKSIGEIYGLLFVSRKPLAMDDIMNRLDISLGAASQGLKLLRSLGAVRTVYSPGARRDYFAADLELSKFATVFIKEELRPRIERALERIQHMESLLVEMPADERHATRQRLIRLRHWLEKGEKMLPWALKFLVK
jgi:HTH-type transcriptional regulator, glycine betaine synthesis regulator